MASWNPVHLPTEIKDLIIDELDIDIDGFSEETTVNRAALRSCLFVSRHFRQRARRLLFRSIYLYDDEGLPHFRERLFRLHQLIESPANDHSLGIVSDIRNFSIMAEFGDHEEGSDDESEDGEEESTVANVTVKYLPGILKALMTGAHNLRHFHMESSAESDLMGCNWTALPSEVRSTVRVLLTLRPLWCLEMRNFNEVPNDFFHQTNITHLVTRNLTPRELEPTFDESPAGSSFHGVQLTLGPVETLDTDQYFPIHRMVDVSRNQSSQTHLLKKIKLLVLDRDDFTKVAHLLHAAYLVEESLLYFTSLLDYDYPLETKLDFSPLQNMTDLTMMYSERLITSSLDSVPKSLEHAFTLLKSGSSIVFLTLEFSSDFRSPDYTVIHDDIIYQPKDEHWKPLDSALSGPLYPRLRCLDLHINLNSESSQIERRFQASMQDTAILLKAAFPYVSDLWTFVCFLSNVTKPAESTNPELEIIALLPWPS
ncbi:hypothetical protein GALMADRAFT_159883 [Galerina marginata CBS 339.88]|uniref:F-box domain-containing protein n=1 Tax=Galerina marginata (strain CBS 339.88) TaxID=685588 RepID=A0A067SHK7_GALM3|nr:hypothetical protein GALMADRAFT_159883 [Galerina marginata CBS 339.88]